MCRRQWTKHLFARPGFCVGIIQTFSHTFLQFHHLIFIIYTRVYFICPLCTISVTHAQKNIIHAMCVFVYMCVYMYICLCVGECMCAYAYVWVWVWVCVCVCESECVWACVWACVCVCVCVCVYVCVYVGRVRMSSMGWESEVIFKRLKRRESMQVTHHIHTHKHAYAPPPTTHTHTHTHTTTPLYMMSLFTLFIIH